jgi:hypothetical protein
MGTLVPNTKYIYERVDDKVFARREGDTERILIGYDYNRDPLDYRNYLSDPTEAQLWHDIRQEAKNNPTLHEALERVKIIYYLSKEHGDSKT